MPENNSENVKISKKKYGDIRIAFVLLCIAIVGQSMMVTGALNVSISGIEKAFYYNSFQVAFIDTTYNLSFAICSLILGYTINSKKLRWIGVGAFVMCLGCFIFIIPIFIRPDENVYSIDAIFICNLFGISHKQSDKNINLIYLFMMCLGYLFIGIGAAPLHTLAISFIDENSNSHQGALFNGIYYASSAFGPAITFGLYSVFSKFPLIIWKENMSYLTPDSPNWIGAYWLVYLSGALILFCVSIPLYMFPTKIKHDGEMSENSKVSKKTVLTYERIKNLSKKSLSNVRFVMISANVFFDGIMMNAIGTFMAKYIEVQFNISSGQAALFAGAILIMGAVLGLFSGGMVIRIFKLNIYGLSKFIVLFSFICVISLNFLLIKCGNTNIYGVEQNLNSHSVKFTTSCSSRCNCDIQQYFPVCDEKDITYFSPCSIGCLNQTGNKGLLTFTNCTCDGTPITNTSIVNQGICKKECKTVYWFLFLGFISLILEFITYVPTITFTMRVLDDETRLLGLSIQQIIIRLSYLIGPLIQGPLIDMACVLFNSTNDGNLSGNCINYDKTKLALVVTIPSLICKTLSTFFVCLACKASRDTNTE